MDTENIATALTVIFLNRETLCCVSDLKSKKEIIKSTIFILALKKIIQKHMPHSIRASYSLKTKEITHLNIMFYTILKKIGWQPHKFDPF